LMSREKRARTWVDDVGATQLDESFVLRRSGRDDGVAGKLGELDGVCRQ
jgi:hypothetical protein